MLADHGISAQQKALDAVPRVNELANTKNMYFLITKYNKQ